MSVSKIEKLGLQTEFLPTYRKAKRNISETARILSERIGQNISNMSVTRYLESINGDTKVPKTVREETKKVIKENWIEEKGIIVEFYQEVIQTAMGILRNAKTDKDKSYAVSTVMQTLNKALESHGIGGGAKVQINQQFNTTVIDEKKLELKSVLKKYVNGNSRELLNDLRTVFSSH